MVFGKKRDFDVYEKRLFNQHLEFPLVEGAVDGGPDSLSNDFESTCLVARIIQFEYVFVLGSTDHVQSAGQMIFLRTLRYLLRLDASLFCVRFSQLCAVFRVFAIPNFGVKHLEK